MLGHGMGTAWPSPAGRSKHTGTDKQAADNASQRVALSNSYYSMASARDFPVGVCVLVPAVEAENRSGRNKSAVAEG